MSDGRAPEALTIEEVAGFLSDRFEGMTQADAVSQVAHLLLELMCNAEQTELGDCCAAAHRALCVAQMEHHMIPDTRRPPPPPPEPPPWNANPNVIALNAKLVEVQQQLDVATQRWRDLERQRAEDQARRDFEERFPGAGAG